MLAAGVVAVVVARSQLSGGRADHELEAPLEIPVAADAAVATAVFARARARMRGEPPAGTLDGVVGPRLWLCGYPTLPARGQCGEGPAGDVGAAVDQAIDGAADGRSTAGWTAWWTA